MQPVFDIEHVTKQVLLVWETCLQWQSARLWAIVVA